MIIGSLALDVAAEGSIDPSSEAGDEMPRFRKARLEVLNPPTHRVPFPLPSLLYNTRTLTSIRCILRLGISFEGGHRSTWQNQDNAPIKLELLSSAASLKILCTQLFLTATATTTTRTVALGRAPTTPSRARIHTYLPTLAPRIK